MAFAAPGYYVPAAYHVASPVYSIPGPYAIHSYEVRHSVQPVEQHGYSIAY